jgi:zinc protease
MMQLVYLYFTQPRVDNEAFEAFIQGQKEFYKNVDNLPSSVFFDSIVAASSYPHPFSGRLMNADIIEKVDYQLGLKMYRERFMNGDQFVFTFVGNINPDSVQKIVEQYLGALPKVKTKETFRKEALSTSVKGIKSKVFDYPMETPISSAVARYHGVCDYTLKNKILMDILKQVLETVFFEKVREEKSGTYGARVRGITNKYPYPKFNLDIKFETNPEMVDKLMAIIYNEIDNIVENGVRETDFNKATEFMKKEIRESKANNYYWLNTIEDYNYTALDMDTDYETILNQLTPEDVKHFAAYLFGQGNRIEVIMNPK